MTDHDEIRNLITRFAHNTDDNFEETSDQIRQELVECFHEDAEIDTLGTLYKGEEIRQLISQAGQLVPPEKWGPKHLMLPPAIDVNGNKATASADCLMLVFGPQNGGFSDGWSIAGAVRYNWDIENRDGRWRFKKMVHTSFYPLDLGRVVRLWGLTTPPLE